MTADGLRQEQVLVVDDEPMVRDVVVRVLQTLFANVAAAEDGEQAIAHLGKHPVDLLVTDLKMPGKDGIDVVRAAVARDPRTRIIAVSGFITGVDEQTLGSLGAEVLRKPFDVTALLTLVERVLDRP
ncbi:MAG: response regulator [Sandaracinaceae bacterium]|nr:response regulator [Sandaracinaceae bacterium]